MANATKIRKDFPILQRKVHGKPLYYLDSAATSQKPQEVIDAIEDYYKKHNANVHRSIHTLGEEATAIYEKAHEDTAKFINAPSYENIILTRNTTESINLLAYSLLSKMNRGDEIVVSIMEHHSNFVPWQQIAAQKGLKFNVVDIDEEGNLDMESLKSSITKNTKLVSLTHVSNVLGTINPIKEITKIAHENNALMVVDGAQAVPHKKVDIKSLDVDFYAFSGHKMLAPTGIGVLYGKKHLLESMQPFMYGGEMIREVSIKDTTFNNLPYKFEAGTPNIGGAAGLSAAISYYNKVGMDKVESHCKNLTDYAYGKLKSQKDITIYGPKKRGPVVTFNLDKVHAHDVAQVLDSEGVAVRAGHHCCMPLMTRLDLQSTARASFQIYNTEEDIDVMVKALDKTRKLFRV